MLLLLLLWAVTATARFAQTYSKWLWYSMARMFYIPTHIGNNSTSAVLPVHHVCPEQHKMLVQGVDPVRLNQDLQ